jgi:GDPmannose 4,6-dehydratase
MWLMLQQDEPDDYVVGTGQAHSVEEFVRIAFAHAGLDWERHVVVDPQFCRPAEVDLLLADPSRAVSRLGWRARVGFEDMVRQMVDADLAALPQAARAA